MRLAIWPILAGVALGILATILVSLGNPGKWECVQHVLRVI